MKVEINNKEQNNKIKFPCLMITQEGSCIILATKNTGGLLHGFALKHGAGMHYSEGWALSKFKPFKGSITLSND